MPELSRFYGIIIRMFYGDHPPPLSRNQEPDKIEPLD